ncbi:MAG: hypothetical protein AAFQ79_06690 [Pseudomonadota bacterium]
MGGTMADGQRDIFTERLKRIEKGGGNTAGRMMVGPTDHSATKGKAREASQTGAVGNAFMIVFAACIGFLCMLTGRVAAFHLTTASPEPIITSGSMALFADFGIAAVLMLVLAWSFRLGSGMRRIALVAGFLAVMVGEGLIIAQAPLVFEALFSPDYVAAMMAAPSPFAGV